MWEAGLILLHFSDVDLREKAIHEFYANFEHGPWKRSAERKKSEVVGKGSSPVRKVEKLVIDSADNDPVVP